MKSIYKIIAMTFLLMLFVVPVATNAQNQEREISGVVIEEETGEPIIQASVTLVGKPGVGVATNLDGEFKIKATDLDILNISYLGFETQQMAVAKVEGKLKIVMKLDTKEVQEFVMTGVGAQKKISVTAAISNVEVRQLDNPSSSISNALAGVVPGIIARQTSGEPGNNFSEFWIRGISTFGANSSALVLVDGVERDMNEINVQDIESFSVLKDASATAVFGSRGANGVVLITTKRGVAGKVRINFQANYSVKQRTRSPEYIGGIKYAEMANEAALSRYRDEVYPLQDLEILRNNFDPDLMPNVNWRKLLFKNYSQSYEARLNISGGGQTARYYVSGSYYNDGGNYRTNADAKGRQNTNATYERYNYRANVDMDITNTTVLDVGIGGWLTNSTAPGALSSDLWSSVNAITPLTVPRYYSNGLIPAYGPSDSSTSPEVLLKETGWRTEWKNKTEANAELRQDLKFITPGLKMSAKYALDLMSSSNITRRRTPELWYAESNRDENGELIMIRQRQESLLTVGSSSSGTRRYTGEVKIEYGTTINEKHRLDFLLRGFREEKADTGQVGSDFSAGIPYRNLAFSGKGTYSFMDRYLLEMNFGYTGSENFAAGHRFGLFPAVSAGWVLSEESFIKENLGTYVNLFKIRASYGENGLDKVNTRFPYISFIEGSAGYVYGENGTGNVAGYRITAIGAEDLSWEMSKKTNFGIDAGFFNDMLTGYIDIFQDKRSDIFMKRSQMPYSTGLQDIQPWANVGKMENRGFDGNISFSNKIGNVNFTLRGNMTYSKTEVIDKDEALNALPYQMEKGYRLNRTFGLIALGLFKDQADVDNSPVQYTGDVLPGDIKYKDVNGDGIINDDDKVPLGFTTVPNMVYGFAGEFKWKEFDLSVRFQGSGKADFFIGGDSHITDGDGVYPFNQERTGNILEAVSNPKDRWISREISGDPSTENPNAVLPRLTYGQNTNNNKNSTFWLRDGKYLRLKELQFGYTVPRKYTQKLFMESARIAFVGYDLFVMAPFKWWDPEPGSKNGGFYPKDRMMAINLRVSF